MTKKVTIWTYDSSSLKQFNLDPQSSQRNKYIMSLCSQWLNTFSKPQVERGRNLHQIRKTHFLKTPLRVLLRSGNVISHGTVF
jgi:hypothetical protein